jgi:hypothetical protein
MKYKFNREVFLGITVAVLAAFLCCQRSNDISFDDKTENRNQILNIYDFAIGRSILEIPT